jgi:hypothetical protein
VVGDLLRHRSEPQSAVAPVAVGADDHQISVSSRFEERRRGRPRNEQGAQRYRLVVTDDLLYDRLEDLGSGARVARTFGG